MISFIKWRFLNMVMSQGMIKQVFSNMIDYFRTEVGKLNNHEIKYIQVISSLNKPCQLHVISSPAQNHHFVIKTHFHDLEDKLIRVIQLHQNNFVSQLKELIEDSIWTNQKNRDKFPFNGIQYPCPNELGQEMIRFGQNIVQYNNYHTENYGGFGVRMVINKKIAVWHILGKIEEWDFKKEVNRFVSQCKQEAVAYQQNSGKHDNAQKNQLPVTKYSGINKEMQISKSLSGFGTYFYPSILIGELAPTIEDQIFRNYDGLAKNVFVTKIDGMTIAISKGGLLGIQSNDSNKAEKMLNTIMAVTLLSGLPVYSVRKFEIASIRFEKNTLKMQASQWSISSIRMQIFSSLMVPGLDYQEHARAQISLADLKLTIKRCEKIWNEHENQKFADLLLNCHDLLQDGRYSQSFLTSWTIIEQHLYDLWVGKLADAEVTQRTRKDLNRWTLYQVLEILHVDKLITEDNYHDLRELQKFRNDVIHEGYMITEKQAGKCYRIASAIVREKTGITDTVRSTRTVYY